MNEPAKPDSPNPSPSGGRAAGSLAEAVVTAALAKKEQQPQQANPDEKWAEMGGELYDAIEAKDKATFGKLFAKQVKIAVAEAMRGHKR